MLFHNCKMSTSPDFLPNTLVELELSKLKKEVLGPTYIQVFDKAAEAYLKNNWKECCGHSNLLLDIIWEHLNTGNWKDVDITWRYAYTYASLFKSVSLINQSFNNLIPAIKTCDMGLLLGAPILKNILSKYCSYLQKASNSTFTVSETAKIEEPSSKRKKISVQYPDISKSMKIFSVENPSLETFLNEFKLKNRPAVITKTIDYWPAFNERKWSINYIKHVAGCRTVPVELGSKYTDECWSQKLMLLSEFIDKYIEKTSSEKSTGYLAQHELFEQIPELEKDISVPSYCALGEEEEVDINAWFGPAGTISPLHHDPKHNFLCQVIGEKYIKLYSQDYNEYLYPHESALLFNTSQIDVENPDLKQFPKFKHAESIECILKAGEMLYIPPKMWHYVRSLSTSFSVSFWWQ